MSRIFNFNAGPAALPLEVLEEVQAELLVSQTFTDTDDAADAAVLIVDAVLFGILD